MITSDFIVGFFFAGAHIDEIEQGMSASEALSELLKACSCFHLTVSSTGLAEAFEISIGTNCNAGIFGIELQFWQIVFDPRVELVGCFFTADIATVEEAFLELRRNTVALVQDSSLDKAASSSYNIIVGVSIKKNNDKVSAVLDDSKPGSQNISATNSQFCLPTSDSLFEGHGEQCVPHPNHRACVAVQDVNSPIH